MKASELRESFLKYFEKNKHKRVASSSLVPANDPTLFFTNAGMVQFKNVFLGDEKRDYKRATTSQKCMRVSGKHNDLENVGHTPRHHTFFEMLGNFSFGDYFKKDAIAYGWEYLTKEVGLEKDRLYITIFETDDEAEKLWKKHVSADRIYRLGEKDNFWAMGETGPCGPCSEIHYDMNPSGPVKAEDFENDRFMEVWNLVFMQFNRSSDGRMVTLAKPSIDTGMGLERLAAVVEGVHGNYETDLFLPIIRDLEKICGRKYTSKYTIDAGNDVSMRVVADHIRAMVFLIGDGVQPSNEGRGYVLRRIIRRAARHGKLLKIDKPFFVPLAHIVIDLMGASYPELIQHKSFIEKVVANEEERFGETLEKGLDILDSKFRGLKERGADMLPGKDVFTLYDTYGFPKDLTEDIASDAGFKIDESGFEKFMNEQRERARSAWKGSGEEAVADIYKDLNKKGVETHFVGYDKLSSDSKIIAIIKDGREVDSAQKGDDVSFIVDVTPFYGESGGQVGDIGMAVNEEIEVSIDDATRPLPSMIAHHGRVEKGEVKKGDQLALAVDAERRKDTMRNHTATHILHRALREILGEHVKQSGSYVAPDRLRFDFSHFQGLTPEELEEVETDANRIIRENMEVKIEELPYKEAIDRGAIAFFGDKYGDTVRTITVGDYSCELCGGTHVGRTGDIGMVKIVSETSVAAGIRRLEAVTGKGVEKYFKDLEKEYQQRTEKLTTEKKKLQKEIEKLRTQLFSGKSADVEDKIEVVEGVNVLAKAVEGAAPKEQRSLAESMKSKFGSGVFIVSSTTGSKTSICAMVSKDVLSKISANDVIKEIVEPHGGTGGGRSDMAQGGVSGAKISESEMRKKAMEVLLKKLRESTKKTEKK